MANQFLSLALFLMLLSFFIVMNAVSSYDDAKSEPVMSSLSLAFSNRTVEVEGNPVVVPSPTTILATRTGDTLEVLEGLFDAHVAGFQTTRNRLGTVMHVRADVGNFKNAISIPDTGYKDISAGEEGSFVQTMITLLRSEKKGQSYRVDMLLNTPEDPIAFQKKSPDRFMQSLKLVSGFAETLENSGLPKKMISAGLAKGESGFVDLYFYRYKPFNMVAEIEREKRKNGGL